jgi:hypothetical protein
MAERKLPSRLVLHASATNLYWVFIFIAVNGVLVLLYAFLDMWRAGEWGPDAGLAGVTLPVLLGIIAYCERKARWLVGRPKGLEIIERTRTRLVPWNQVRIESLGAWGSSPGAERYYLELRDGSAFTFLGDPDAIARLPKEARFVPWKR